jgi:hypothetical protein
MSGNITPADDVDRVLAILIAEVERRGYRVRRDGPGFEARRTVPIAGWWLGRRQVESILTCRLHAADRSVRLNERQIETGWGLAPPLRRVLRWRQHGLTYGEAGSERWFGGDAAWRYGAISESIASSLAALGWSVATPAPSSPA